MLVSALPVSNTFSFDDADSLLSDSQLGEIFATFRLVGSSGGILVVFVGWGGGDVFDICWIEAKAATKHLPCTRQLSKTKITSSKNSLMLKSRNLDFKVKSSLL